MAVPVGAAGPACRSTSLQPVTAIAATAPAGEVPTGFAAWNTSLDHYNTFSWDQRAWALAPGDLTQATVTHWLYGAAVSGATAFSTPVPHSVKRPLEHRVWYAYPGQGPSGEDEVGSWHQPSRVGRVLEDGTSQITETTYTDRGTVLTRTDPLGPPDDVRLRGGPDDPDARAPDDRRDERRCWRPTGPSPRTSSRRR